MIVPKARQGNLLSDGNGTVSHLSSRIKSQGVHGSGEPKGEAKAIARSAQAQGAWYESATNRSLETRSQCELHVSRAKPIFRLVEVRNRC